MKTNHPAPIFVFLLTFMLACVSATAAEFCWKDSYGRGVGTLPSGCAAGQENQNGLCYKACPAGMTGEGPVCWSACPAGYIDMGATCHINKPLTVDGGAMECKASTFGVCYLWGVSCPAGYSSAGLFCALNTPSLPAGFTGSALDPVKNTSTRGAGTIPGGCGSTNDRDAGLCYDKCRAGHSGVGPVCWTDPPVNWVACGMGAAKDQVTCGLVTANQVYSVGQLSMTVASLGSTTALNAGMSAPQDAALLTKLRAEYNAMKVQWDLLKAANQNVQAAVDAADLANKGKRGYTAMNTAGAVVTEADMIRLAAQIAGIVDKTGTMDVVAAYSYAKCSDYALGKPDPLQIRWVASSYDTSNKGANQPAGAFIGGYEGQRPLRVCRAVHQGGTHPGKIYGGKCNIAYGTSSVVLPSYEVMVVDAQRVGWTASSWESSNMGQTQPAGAILGGFEGQRPLRLCRATNATGQHPGKIYGGKCNIAYGANSVVFSAYEVLVPK